MAISFTATQIILSSLRVINDAASGQSRPSSEMAEALQALNMMVKNWMQSPTIFHPGERPWARSRKSHTLVDDGKDITVCSSGCNITTTDTPLGVIACNRKTTDNVVIPMEEMTLNEFEELTTRDTDAPANRYYYERGLSSGILYLDYNVPSDVTDTLEVTFKVPVVEFSSLTSTPDWTEEFYEALKFNLAVRLAPEYGEVASQDVKELATLTLASAELSDQTTERIKFAPNRRFHSGGKFGRARRF